MSQRKLLQEVDKVLKKVKEGLAEFDIIYDKFQVTESDNQSYREKLESDLKREIKKLQKHREQIKSWLSKDDVKERNSLLMENRRLIENGMERFKSVEKIMKTKKFSTEALSNPDLIKDPRELKKRDQFVFVEDCLEELQKQLESYEAQELADKVERHQFHITNLENILKMLQNDELEPDVVEEYQEDIRYYVDNNDDPDFIEYETIYEDMGCETQLEDTKEQPTPVKQKVKLERSPKKKNLSPAPPNIVNKARSSVSTAGSVTISSAPASQPSSGSPVSAGTKQVKKDTVPQIPDYLPPPKDLSKEIEENIEHDLNVKAAFANPLFKEELGYWLQAKRPLIQPYENMPEKMMKQLESSLLNCPDSLDADTPYLYQHPLSLPHPTSIFFPNEPIRFVASGLNSNGRVTKGIYGKTSMAQIMTKFDLDTLFFIFYHYQGTYDQYLASRELTIRGWIYNRVNRCWFYKEVEKLPPGMEQTEEVSWRYFDFQKSWLARRCGPDFVFRQEEFEQL
ncbi:HBL127Wp [Eremothecium sinecaudum]|uniref:HBL127Wp n=1 Tax=Eremothecium sinecaudum TaxID=45286 RepID=A0A125RDW6_9SACH|nr:HBL127Wp [Eremothecium sinecaudum]AMD18775.1 HBL127Wp [Eremothecium sinecaudum]